MSDRRSVPCAYCGAKVGESCRATDGSTLRYGGKEAVHQDRKDLHKANEESVRG